jgi:hypothetical protein
MALYLMPAALVAGQARYARLGEFEGQVEVQLQAADPWMPAERNLPLSQGAWIRTGPASRVEIELDDGSVLRLGDDSQAEISDYTQLSTGQRITTLSLDHGLAYFGGQPRDKDALTLSVPGAQVIYVRKARIRLEAGDAASTISVLEGVAKFSCPAAEIDITSGTTTRVEPDNPSRFFLEREIAAMALDRWSADRDKAIAGNVSGTHVVERYGLADLDSAGEWVSTDQYGPVWKPKTPDGWVPFQKGRWRWYDLIGYTWVSDDAWGWLPYHYGRWARSSDLGWIWVPTISQTFKPGEVYWLRAAKLAGWGPLVPGEQWTADTQPDLFLNAYMTWAAFAPDARLIDPASFTGRPREPLAVAAFAVALPSPAFPPARLDATRPVLRAGSTRVNPVVRGVTYQDPTDDLPSPPQQQPRSAFASPPPPSVVVVTQPPPDPQMVAVPVPVPYPVIAGIINPPAPPAHVTQKSGISKSSAPVSKPAPPPAGGPPASVSRLPHKKLHDRGEGEIYSRVLEEANDPGKQLVDLDNWMRHYPNSDFDDNRAVIFMNAYNRTGHPDKVVELGSRLMAKGVDTLYFNPSEILSVLYLTTISAGQIGSPNRVQRATFRNASQLLLDYTPTFFALDQKPQNISEQDWTNIRSYMEGAAHRVLDGAPASH